MNGYTFFLLLLFIIFMYLSEASENLLCVICLGSGLSICQNTWSDDQTSMELLGAYVFLFLWNLLQKISNPTVFWAVELKQWWHVSLGNRNRIWGCRWLHFCSFQILCLTPHFIPWLALFSDQLATYQMH